MFSVAFQRWVEEGHSKFATDSATAALQDESSEAQNGPESDRNNLLLADNHVSDNKQFAFPTEARERQKAREKRAKETGDSQRQEAKEIRQITSTTAEMTSLPL